MIVNMKRMELLLYHKEREQFLENLRTLGVVHVVESPQQEETAEVQVLTQKLKACAQTISSLMKIQNVQEISIPQIQECDSVEEVIEKYNELKGKIEKTEQEIAALNKDCSRLEPWGDFKPESVHRLADINVRMRFFLLPQKKFDTLDKKNLVFEEINRTDGMVYFVVLERGESVEIDAEEVRVGDISLSEIRKKIKDFQLQQKYNYESLNRMVTYIDVLRRYRTELFNKMQYERASLSMKDQASGKLLSLSGWFPLERERKIKEFLEKHPVYYTIRDPYPDEDVPVLLKNRPFSKLFEPIIGLYSLPDYREIDTSPFIAPFFALFFGLCLGDMGYGLVVLIGALIARCKVGPKLKPFMTLGIILGFATAISGLLINSFFGQPIFGGSGVESAFFSSGVQKFAPLSSLKTESGTVFPAMSLALLLGFIQVFFGMGLQAYVRIKNYGLKGGIEPIASIVMVFGALVWAAHADFLNLGFGNFTVGPLNVGKLLLAVSPGAGKTMLWGGLVLYFLFNNFQKKILVRPLIGIWEFYQFSTGFLSNILSYLRLFALGLAGGLLGAAFNQIAFLLITKDGVINYASWGIIGTILILIIGHTLNLALSALSAFVHPLRLTFVEFYSALSFKGGSKPFMPFAKIEKQ